jgi:hypothetical protein
MFPVVVLAQIPLVALLLSSLVVNNKSSNINSSNHNSNSNSNNNQPATNNHNNNNNKKHICVDITAHGLGHVAQTTAVLNQLDPNQVRLTIRSMASRSVLEERLPNFAVSSSSSSSSSLTVIPYAQDAGMVMKDALHVDVAKTMEWYRTFHEPRHYQERIRHAAADLEVLEPDLLLCNVPYLSLEAAHQLWGMGGGGGSGTKTPAVIALCSLNWADVFYSYCAKEPGASSIYHDMLQAYSRADVFVQPTPSMPMTNLHCRKKQSIGPIAMQGRRRMATTTTATTTATTTTTVTTSLLSSITYELTGQMFEYFVLIGVGGMTIDNIPLEHWPRLENTCWIVPDAMLFPVRSVSSPQHAPPPQRPDFIAQSLLESPELFSYIDLIASVDCILTKTGYGTQTEAVVHGIPTLCIERHDWPEHVYLKQWHQDNGIVAFCDWQDICNPQRRMSSSSYLADTISNLIAQKQKKSGGILEERVQPTGAQEAATIIRQRLGLLDD